MADLFEEYYEHKDVKEAGEAVKALNIPEKMVADLLTSGLNKAMDRNGKHTIDISPKTYCKMCKLLC